MIHLRKKSFHVSRNRTLMFLHNPVDDTENKAMKMVLRPSCFLRQPPVMGSDKCLRFLLALSISRCFSPGLVLQAACYAAQAGTGLLWAAYHANVASFLDMLWGEGRVFIHIHRERMSERERQSELMSLCGSIFKYLCKFISAENASKGSLAVQQCENVGQNVSHKLM